MQIGDYVEIISASFARERQLKVALPVLHYIGDYSPSSADSPVPTLYRNMPLAPWDRDARETLTAVMIADKTRLRVRFETSPCDSLLDAIFKGLAAT